MTRRDRIVVLVLVAAVVVAGGWFTLLKPRREEAASLADKIVLAQDRLDAATAGAASAERARAQYERDYAVVAKLGKAVPVDDDLPSLVVQLEDAAERSGVDFRSIKVAAPSGAPAAAPPANQAGAVGAAEKEQGKTGADATAPAPGGGTTPAGTAAAPPATQATATALPPGAAIGPAGFPTMPFDFSFEGKFFRLQGFLERLEDFTRLKGRTIDVSGRLLTIDGFSLTAGRKGFPDMEASIRATAFLLPAEQGLTAGATPEGPVAAAAPPSTPPSAVPAPAATAVPAGG